MYEPTGPWRDAANLIFNLPDYRVISADDLPDGGRRVVVKSTVPADCPCCGVLASRVRSKRLQRLRDVPVAGAVELVWRKRLWFCDEPRCSRGTFAKFTAQVPRGARATTRLRQAVVAAVTQSGRAISETARAHAVSWWLIQAALTAATVLLPEVDQLPVTRIGIDGHRCRSVRYFRAPAGGWRHFEPWISTIVDLDTGQVLGVIDGRNSAPINAWLASRTRAWRDRIEVVAIGPSAEFRKALRQQLPHAAVCVDAFHIVKLANDTLTAVRQRVTREQHGHRGGLHNRAWVMRKLLLRAGDTLTKAALARL